MRQSSNSTIDSENDSHDQKYYRKLKKSLQLNQRHSKKLDKIRYEKMVIQCESPHSKNKYFSPELRPYAQEIMSYVISQEAESMVAESYMKWQTDINVSIRQILIEWMIQVATGLNLRPQTLHLACLMVDKYCYSRNVILKKYQIVGGACLFIAAKFQEIKTPSLKNYVNIAAGQYNQEELLKMEGQILMTLNFNIQEKSSFTLFQLKANQHKVSQQVRDLGQFLLELCLLQYDFSSINPTYLGLSIFFTAFVLKRQTHLTIQEFTLQNNLHYQTFYKHLGYIDLLYQIKHSPQFASVHQRYSHLFHKNFKLK